MLQIACSTTLAVEVSTAQFLNETRGKFSKSRFLVRRLSEIIVRPCEGVSVVPHGLSLLMSLTIIYDAVLSARFVHLKIPSVACRNHTLSQSFQVLDFCYLESNLKPKFKGLYTRTWYD